MTHPAQGQSPRDLARAWIRAARDEAVIAAIDALHAMIADQVEARRPVCVRSGRCCRFARAGHRLYTTGLEAARTLVVLGLAGDDGASPGASLDLRAAHERCPFLRADLCSVHQARPAACRVYYCDQTATDWVASLGERAHAMARAIHDRFGVPYRYAPWGDLLAMLTR
jgi:hypothetical protein